MFWTKNKASTRKVILSVAVLCLAAVALITGGQFNSADASTAVATTTAVAPDAVFPADAPSLGAIPDPPVAGPVCGDFAATSRNVTFNVTGVTAPITDVRVNVSITHTWVGDLKVELIAPAAAASHSIFNQTGSTTLNGCGDDSNLGAAYNFFDTAPAAPTWWQHAATSTTTMAAGSFRASTTGGVVGGGANTLITPSFTGLTTPQINGTWTLRVTDGGEGDTGSVTAASLTVDGAVTPPGDAPIDFNNDGRTDYVVVRNIGGGASGQVRWFYNLSSGGATVAKDWGLATDFFVSGDWDLDGNDDIAVWRPGAATVATFYVLRSSDFAAIIEPFGQTGDDPTVVGDYNNDGRTDFAVYRPGLAAGDPSTWFYRTAQGGPITYTLWGVNGDFPAPGDYDGDGSYDFVIQRAAGGSGQFWIRPSTGAVSVITYGLSSDVVLPGDYDGDGSTDISVARAQGSQIAWYYRKSSDGSSVGPIVWGNVATDQFAQGDYDGDGKTDQGIWRNGLFISLNSTNGAATFFSLGAVGDYPVADFNSH